MIWLFRVEDARKRGLADVMSTAPRLGTAVDDHPDLIAQQPRNGEAVAGASLRDWSALRPSGTRLTELFAQPHSRSQQGRKMRPVRLRASGCAQRAEVRCPRGTSPSPTPQGFPNLLFLTTFLNWSYSSQFDASLGRIINADIFQTVLHNIIHRFCEYLRPAQAEVHDRP